MLVRERTQQPRLFACDQIKT